MGCSEPPLAGQSAGSDNLSAIITSDRAFPASVAELGSLIWPMKRSLTFKLVVGWCGIYSLMLLGTGCSAPYPVMVVIDKYRWCV
jgi:hypothetical protein